MTKAHSPQTRAGRKAPRPPPAAGSRVSSRTEALTLGEVVLTAVDLIDSGGLKKFTMRTLGQRLGVEAMALYHYVPSREALLDAIVDHVVDELYGDPLVHLQASRGWAVYLERLAHGVRRTALAHPEVFPLVATRPPAAPWLKPPLRSLRWTESLLTVLGEEGFSDADAVKAYRAFASFLLGHLLLEVSALGVDTGPVDEVDPTAPRRTDLAGYPHLARLEPELAQDRAAEEFDESLASLLVRLADVAAQ